MKRIGYVRVSTQKQSYDRQILSFKEYFTRMGIDPSSVEYVQEKKTSYSSFKDRAIFPILEQANNDTIIYACQLDRFGRSVQDVLDLVDYAMEKGVTLVTIDNGNTIENKSTTGKLMLTILAAVAEMERSLRAERCLAGKEAEKEEIAKNGYRIARVSGKIQTRIGNEKGCDMSKAVAAQAKLKQEQRIEWMNESVAYKWVIGKFKSGMKRTDIVAEFNKLHELQPDVFCSRRGARLTPGLLSHWLKIGGYR